MVVVVVIVIMQQARLLYMEKAISSADGKESYSIMIRSDQGRAGAEAKTCCGALLLARATMADCDDGTAQPCVELRQYSVLVLCCTVL